jgi:NAD(P)-dependent dehydrogenase (short-subunit alcohol dehydrogenase family)
VVRPGGEEVDVGSLDGQVAVVTGAGSGIGRATAVALAREGARVAAVGRRKEPLEETLASLASDPDASFAVPADVTDADAGEQVVQEVVHRYGRVDLLVNNAGLNVARRDLAALSVADWQAILQVNLTGTFLMTHAVLPVMREQGSGTIVNVSSIAGLRARGFTGPAYNAAKAGVNSLTESVNLAERRNGIRACAVCPGEVETPILDKRPTPPTPEARALMLQPEDVASSIVFVATLPPRATVELLSIYPTVHRDMTDELPPA